MPDQSQSSEVGPLPRRHRPAAKWRFLAWGLAGTALLAWIEATYSPLQAILFHSIARESRWVVAPGQATRLEVPAAGPWNERFGYTRLDARVERLKSAGFVVTAQARQSDGFVDLLARGLHPIYREKTRGGLTLVDSRRLVVHAGSYPERQFKQFDEIPPLLIEMLLYLENRGLLERGGAWRNPAVDWPRLAQAVVAQAGRSLDWDAPRFGASTLATQIEKYRHSPGGRTRDAEEKLVQMLSASLRAYRGGRDTLAYRERVVLDFLNTVPLGGFPGFGEVHGLGDGLWAWYGRDLGEVTRALGDSSMSPQVRGPIVRDALSLLIAQRRPSALLGSNGGRLAALTDSYLRLMAQDGIITEPLRDAALAARSVTLRMAQDDARASFIERKGVNDVRAALLGLLGVSDLHTLDRQDLTAYSSLDARTQQGVAAFLERLDDPAVVACLGLRVPRVLGQGDPAGVRYSFTLYESSPIGNLLRVQADNLDQPLDLNAGTKIDLGSSAKLRTLVSYLNAIAELHDRWASASAEALEALRGTLPPGANLSRWAIDYLLRAEDRALSDMLVAALDRRYSANPNEVFFTGGGQHRFSNFQKEDDRLEPTVAEALAQSINLSFVRLMRDVVHYHAYEAADAPARALPDGGEEVRREFLGRFADYEGRRFLGRFWAEYGKLADDDLLPALAAKVGKQRRRLAAAFFAVMPDGRRDRAAFAAFLQGAIGVAAGSPEQLNRLYDELSDKTFTLADWGYLAQRHPLELWLVKHLLANPGAGYAAALAASADARQEAARWLFEARHREAQDVRLAIVVEQLAFERLAREWRALGYPFDALVPSLASSIGSSADRPAALAELAGVLLNHGRRLPMVRVEQIELAVDTPFETRLARPLHAGEPVLRPEVAAVARGAMIGVVEAGTARRLQRVYRTIDGSFLVLGGKTGTGDHRYRTVGPGGVRLSERVMNRAATFVFFLGDRHFGVMTAFVPGEAAGRYEFTSSLPVRLLAELEPLIGPLAGGKPGRAMSPCLSSASAAR